MSSEAHRAATQWQMSRQVRPQTLMFGTRENQARVRTGLEILPQKAILELGPDEDLRDWVVLRVADEVVVDVMLSACGIPFEETLQDHRLFDIDGVPIPFASPKLLLRMKQTHRAKDEEDRILSPPQDHGRGRPRLTLFGSEADLLVLE